MSAIAHFLFQNSGIYIGQGLSQEQIIDATALLTGLSAYALKKMGRSAVAASEKKELPHSKTQLRSKIQNAFWKKVASCPTLAKEGHPVVVQGTTVFDSPATGRLEMLLGINRSSDYVISYLFQSHFRGTVLDLGCGTGANAIPLLMLKKATVIAVDKEPIAIAQFKEKIKSPHLTLYNADITTWAYPKNIDAVICVDVLSYLPPAQLRATMQKIFHTLRPQGQFIGTLFFKSQNTVLTEFMSKLGAHFYPGKECAHEIIVHSGFRIVKERVREENHCLEFLAIRDIR